MAEPEKLAGLGHNQPPEPTPPPAPLTIAEKLALDHKALVDRYAELMALAAEAPAEVKDEETFKPLSDLLKAGRSYLAMSEAARKIENEESRRRTATIDAWFKNPADVLTKAMKAIKEKTDAYLEDKRAKEEKARIAAAEAKRLAAVEKELDAQYRDALGELAAYDARKAEEAQVAARLRKEAAARRTDHLKDRGKRLAIAEPYLERRRFRRELELTRQADLRRAAARDELARLEAEGEHRLELEAQDARAAQDAARLAQARIDNEAQLAKAKTETAAARRQETSLGKKAGELGELADDHADQAEDLAGDAARLGKRADRAERHASAGSAAMSRTRSDLGTTASLTKSWKMTALDRDVVDLNLLRGFLHPDAVEVAARGYMMAHRNDPGGPVLEGATFEQLEDGVYR